jgi:hypothetical protein
MDNLIYKSSPPTLAANAQTPPLSDSTGNLLVAVAGTSPPATGQATWAKTTVTMTGASTTVLAANTSRKGFAIFNRVGNAQVDIDPAGGTVAANTGISLLGGDPPLFVSGAISPTGAITGIGTNTQIVNVWELT